MSTKGESTGIKDALDRALDALSDAHRQVVELYVFRGLSARQVAADVNVICGTQFSAANVHEIVHRFRDSLRGGLAAT